MERISHLPSPAVSLGAPAFDDPATYARNVENVIGAGGDAHGTT